VALLVGARRTRQKCGLKKPEFAEVILFIRKPPEGGKAGVSSAWTGVKDLVILQPELERLLNHRIPCREISKD